MAGSTLSCRQPPHKPGLSTCQGMQDAYPAAGNNQGLSIQQVGHTVQCFSLRSGKPDHDGQENSHACVGNATVLSSCECCLRCRRCQQQLAEKDTYRSMPMYATRQTTNFAVKSRQACAKHIKQQAVPSTVAANWQAGQHPKYHMRACSTVQASPCGKRELPITTLYREAEAVLHTQASAWAFPCMVATDSHPARPACCRSTNKRLHIMNPQKPSIAPTPIPHYHSQDLQPLIGSQWEWLAAVSCSRCGVLAAAANCSQEVGPAVDWPRGAPVPNTTNIKAPAPVVNPAVRLLLVAKCSGVVSRAHRYCWQRTGSAVQLLRLRLCWWRCGHHGRVRAPRGTKCLGG